MGNKTGRTIKGRMLISYFSIVILLIAIGLIGIFYVGRVYNSGKAIYENDLKAVQYLKSISENLKELDMCTFHLMVELDWEHTEQCEKQIDLLIADNIKLMDDYSKLEVSDIQRKHYEQGRASILEFHKQINQLLSQLDECDEKQMLIMYQNELSPIKDTTNALIDEAVNIAIDYAEQRNQDNHDIYNKIVWIICLVMIVAIMIAIGISIRMSNYFISKLKSIQLMARRISEYNVSDDITEVENDEFGKTVEALNESQFMIRDLMEKIINESAVISDMGEEVSLAVRKSEQRIEQVNVSILEYDKIVLQIEEHVKRLLEGRSLDEEDEKELARLKIDLYAAKKVLEQARNELSSIAIYLEQIGITSDYQNEIANSHQYQVKKFKVKESEE